MRHIRTAALIVLLLNALALKAENITVTSKAERGPGSLWEAIERANANGTVNKDFIRFNLPGTTIDDRTIILDKLELPTLSSNIEIDGTTQPGTPFGVSGAKVRILKTSLVGAGYFHMIKIYNASDVAIYGLFLDFRISEAGAYGISVFNSQNITIGAAGKGNVLNAAGGSIGSDIVTAGNSIGLRIANNIIGLEPDGVTLAGLGGVQAKMFLRSAGEVEMDHNLINAEIIIQEFMDRPLLPEYRIYSIHDNILGGDHTASMAIGASSRLFINSWTIAGESDATRIHVKNNHFLSGYIELQSDGGEITVQGNKINTDITGTVYTGNTASPAITIWDGDAATLIGGDLPEEKNYIAGGIYGVHAAGAENVTIKKNSIFCTLLRGISSIENTFIESRTGNTVTGRSEPNATIEVYEADHCNPSSECTGKIYIGSTVANAAGQWSFTGPLTPDVVATGTSPAGRTSEFTHATIDIQQLSIIPALCGTPGSIKGIRVTGAVTIRWEDASGNVVGSSPELLDMPAGTYRLYASMNNDPHSDCGATVFTASIFDTKPDIQDVAVTVVNPCGNNDGAIRNMFVTGGYQNTYRWLNERDEEVGTALELVDVPAGTYRLFVYSSSTCFDESDPIVITDQAGPAIDVSNIAVTPATCGNSNGAIGNITLSGAGTLAARWLDANDVEIGRGADIKNLAPGQYRLELDDQSACPAIISAPVTIVASGSITLDLTAMVIRPVGCNNQPGSITGIVAAAADIYTWRNRAGNIVGNALDLTGVPAGDYMLTTENSYSCSAKTAWLTVAAAQGPGWNVKGTIYLPICNESNGRVEITEIAGAQVQSLRWTDAATDATLGTSRTLNDLGPGDYKLYLTDPNNCELEVYTASIPRRTPPALAGVPQVTNETCGRSNGVIIMPGVNGEGPYLVQWTDVSNALVGTEPEAKNLKAGNYFVEVMDKYGCTVKSGAYIVENNPEVLEPAADQAITVGKGLPVRINVTAPFPAIFTLYADAAAAFPLQQNITGAFVMPPLQRDATYYVTLTMDICKSPPAKIAVKAVDNITVGVPNAFSPNGDGVNDVFRPQYSMISSLEYFSVYGRWGNEVFATKTIGMGWNGRMNGADLPAGTYFYVIRGKDVLGNPFEQKGSLLLIR